MRGDRGRAPQPIGVPQANRVDRLLEMIEALSRGRSWIEPRDAAERRDRGYYLAALEDLGAVDSRGCLTGAGRRCAADSANGRAFAFARLFAESPIGRAWMHWSGTSALAGLRRDTAQDFLTRTTRLSAATVRRRAATLAAWLDFSVPAMYQPSLSFVPPPPLDDDEAADGEGAEQVRWPDGMRMPHNEGGARVRDTVLLDLARARDALVLVGYAALPELIDLLARHDRRDARRLRILIGTEPRPVAAASQRTLKDEIRATWTQAGLSIRLADRIDDALDALDAETVEVRLYARLEARIYVTDEAVTVGSSNLTAGGLARAAHGNLRLDALTEPTRHAEVVAYATNLWTRGEDYCGDLKDLLERLLRYVTWQDALARAGLAVLEHDWISAYDEASDRFSSLWPHQRDGIAQALNLLENAGGVMICDPTGSGKTRLGACLIRAVQDLHLRRRAWPTEPVVVAPKGVNDDWQEAIHALRMNASVHSDGILSRPSGSKKARRLRACLEGTDVLVIDEAHRYISPTSNRSRALYPVPAEATLLFTATPINRDLDDLTAMIELIGPENFDDDVLEATLELLTAKTRLSDEARRTRARRVAHAIGQCMVRRTRADIVARIEAEPEGYRVPLPGGGWRAARYPARRAELFDCGSTDRDQRLAEAVLAEVEGLTGVGRHREPWLFSDGDPERIAAEVNARYRRAEGLARYEVRNYMRSSRAAVIWHIEGLRCAMERYGIEGIDWLDGMLARETERDGEQGRRPPKSFTGNMLRLLDERKGHAPARAAAPVLRMRDDIHPWVWDDDAHRQACEEEARRYRSIAEHVGQMSDAREQARCARLIGLRDELGASVIGFDDTLITLADLQRRLRHERPPVMTICGQTPAGMRDDILAKLDKNADGPPRIVLASDCLTEGFNLQGAAAVVHLNMPTTMRAAEQRMGRVDRLDTRHEEVVFYWPNDAPAFQPRKVDLLHQRWILVGESIGVNFMIPGTDRVDMQRFATAVTSGRVSTRDDDAFLGDAFAPIRILLADDEMVPPEVRARMGQTEAQVLAAVDCRPDTPPWCFVALGGEGRRLPRWVLMVGDPDDRQQRRLETDLRAIAEWLSSHLKDARARPPASGIGNRVVRFLHALDECEVELLSPRRRQTIEQARECLKSYWHATRPADRAVTDPDRARLCQKLYYDFDPRPIPPPTLDEFERCPRRPDLRWLADRWWRLMEPARARIRRENDKRIKRLKALRELARHPLSMSEPIDTDVLQKAFEDPPLIAPLDERVVAMILGLPPV